MMPLMNIKANGMAMIQSNRMATCYLACYPMRKLEWVQLTFDFNLNFLWFSKN